MTLLAALRSLPDFEVKGVGEVCMLCTCVHVGVWETLVLGDDHRLLVYYTLMLQFSDNARVCVCGLVVCTLGNLVPVLAGCRFELF